MAVIKMERLQEMAMTTVIFSLTVILLNSSSSLAFPTDRRSNHLLVEELNCDAPITAGDGLLRDMMMLVADFDRDNGLSETEIRWFYRHIVRYNEYVSQTYGRSFIEIADLDHDNRLNYDELLCMLGAMSASNWTRR